MTTRSAHPAARFRPSAIASLLTLAGVLLAAAPALGGATGIANVTFQWTDRVGGTHVMKDVWVTGEEIDPSYNDPAGSGYTNSAGVFVFTGADPEPFQSTTEFSGTVESYLGSGATENARVRSGVGGGIYWQPWPLPAGTTFDVSDPPGWGAFTHTVDNTTTFGQSIHILQFVDFMRSYMTGTLGASAPWVTIDYSTTTNGSYYCWGNTGPSCPEQRLQIDNNNWASPDVILHEYGHHIAIANNRATAIGGDHNFGRDNIGALNGGWNHGTAIGTRLAWSEGVATFLGLLAVNAGNIGAAIPGLPVRDRDLAYDARNTPVGESTSSDDHLVMRTDVESNNALEPGLGTGGRPKGEGDELSVMRVLWDVQDSANEAYGGGGADRMTFGAQAAYDLLAGKATFKDLWVALVEAVEADPTKIGFTLDDPEPILLTALGATLSEYRISNLLHDTPDGPDDQPRLFFDEQNNDNSTRNRVLVYSNDWTTLIDDSGSLNDTNPGESLHSYDVASALAPGTYHWVTLNDSALDAAAAPEELDDWYWSWYDTFTVVPEPGTAALVGVGLALGAAVRRRLAATTG